MTFNDAQRIVYGDVIVDETELLKGAISKLCIICDQIPVWSWTDMHGVAQCGTCGTPYTLYHYDDQNRRLDKPPEVTIKPEYIPALRAYWNESHRRIPSGYSIPGGQELATNEDARLFHEWMRVNAAADRTASSEDL